MYRDARGRLTYDKMFDEVITFSIDWTNDIGDDTIATSVWETFGPTIANDAEASGIASVDVGPSGGMIRNTVTLTTTGQVFVQDVRFRCVDDVSDTVDYQV